MPKPPVAKPAEAGPRAHPGGQGQPLPAGARSRMEATLGEDFSRVRIRSGPEADAAARAVDARAYAHGDELTFAAAGPALETPAGTNLLEHELSHVVEQRHGAPLGVYRSPDDEAESTSQPLRAPHLHLDPGLSGLSLGLSTVDGFDLNDAALKPQHQAAVADAAAKLTMLLTKMPSGRITVSGHADLLGGEDVNMDVGRRRAEAVAAALVKAGVPVGAIQIVSKGKREPVVATKKAEPRNRRVEVRFEGELVTPDPGLLAGRLKPPADAPLDVIGLSRRTPLVTPSPVPPLLQPPGPLLTPPSSKPLTPPTVGSHEPEPQTRAAKFGDLAKALSKTAPVKAAIDRLEQQAETQWTRAPTGEKVAIVSTGVSMAALAAVGIFSDPDARKALLDAADGTAIPVPGVPWLKVVPHTKGGTVGGVIQVDVIKILGGGK